jgi:hypothetical protein
VCGIPKCLCPPCPPHYYFILFFFFFFLDRVSGRLGCRTSIDEVPMHLPQGSFLKFYLLAFIEREKNHTHTHTQRERERERERDRGTDRDR